MQPSNMEFLRIFFAGFRGSNFSGSNFLADELFWGFEFRIIGAPRNYLGGFEFRIIDKRQIYFSSVRISNYFSSELRSNIFIDWGSSARAYDHGAHMHHDHSERTRYDRNVEQRRWCMNDRPIVCARARVAMRMM